LRKALSEVLNLRGSGEVFGKEVPRKEEEKSSLNKKLCKTKKQCRAGACPVLKGKEAKVPCHAVSILRESIQKEA